MSPCPSAGQLQTGHLLVGSNHLDFHRRAPGQAGGAGLSGGGSKGKDCGASSLRLQVDAVWGRGAAVAFSEDEASLHGAPRPARSHLRKGLSVCQSAGTSSVSFTSQMTPTTRKLRPRGGRRTHHGPPARPRHCRSSYFLSLSREETFHTSLDSGG